MAVENDFGRSGKEEGGVVMVYGKPDLPGPYKTIYGEPDLPGRYKTIYGVVVAGYGIENIATARRTAPTPCRTPRTTLGTTAAT